MRKPKPHGEACVFSPRCGELGSYKIRTWTREFRNLQIIVVSSHLNLSSSGSRHCRNKTNHPYYALPEFLTYRIVSIIKWWLFYTTKSEEVSYAAKKKNKVKKQSSLEERWEARKTGESHKGWNRKKEESEEGRKRMGEGKWTGRRKGWKNRALICPDILLSQAFFIFYHNDIHEEFLLSGLVFISSERIIL